MRDAVAKEGASEKKRDVVHAFNLFLSLNSCMESVSHSSTRRTIVPAAFVGTKIENNSVHLWLMHVFHSSKTHTAIR